MTSEIILALISFAGTVIGSMTGVFATSKLSNYRIEQLEKKVDKHNNIIERTYRLEQEMSVQAEKISVANHRIEDLENAKN